MKGDTMLETKGKSLRELYLRNKDIVDGIVYDSVHEAALMFGPDKMMALFSVKETQVPLISKRAA